MPSQDKLIVNADPPAHPVLNALTSTEMAAVLSSSPAGICITKDQTIHWANPTFHHMLGYDQGTLESRPVEVLYPTQAAFIRVAEELIRAINKRGYAVVDTRLLRSDGTAFDCRVRASRMDPEKPGAPVLAVVTDITDIKSLQTQLQQAQKMEAIGVLAGGISHDFNNILMGIQGHLSLMRINAGDAEKILAHIQQVNQLVETAADLTSRLLGFARGGKYQITVLDINQVVDVALNIFKPTRKDIVVNTERENRALAVDGDHSQLEQVFLNLLVNAGQAMVDSGTMTVATRQIHITPDHTYPFEVAPGPYVEVLVADTGIGMDEVTQQRIFDPFFSTKEAGNQKGRGLGLSTVFGIVKNHGGFITVESQKGHGSTFRVCLPSSRRPLSGMADHEENNIDQMPTGSETILFVDDEEEILNLGRNFLEKLGYKTILARNGLEAVEIFKLYRNDIALVVLDLIMPIMGGKEAFARIREENPRIKVLVSTGFNVDEEVEALLQQGCHGFLQKPFSMHKFSRAIREILDRTKC